MAYAAAAKEYLFGLNMESDPRSIIKILNTTPSGVVGYRMTCKGVTLSGGTEIADITITRLFGAGAPSTNFAEATIPCSYEDYTNGDYYVGVGTLGAAVSSWDAQD